MAEGIVLADSHLTAGLPQARPEWFIRPNGFNAAHTIHGLGHTHRVLIHALAIADALGLDAWEREALTCAALWHDIGRTDDVADYYHGAKSAGKAVALGLHEGIDPVVREVALYAVTHHSGSELHGETAADFLGYHELDTDGLSWPWRPIDPDGALLVFRVFKDADGLDRVRLGDLDPSYLRTEPAREMVARAWELYEA